MKANHDFTSLNDIPTWEEYFKQNSNLLKQGEIFILKNKFYFSLFSFLTTKIT